MVPAPAVEPAGRWRMLALLCFAMFAGMSVWFTASALAPVFAHRWGLSASAAAWLTTSVQLGFVAGTAFAAVLNLADVLPARWLFTAAALLAAGANAAVLWSGGYGWALATRFATGFFLAGVYPPGMKMAATWFRRGRGLAIGALVGALTLGKSLPFLLGSLSAQTVAGVVLGASAVAALAGVLIGLFYSPGSFAFPRQPFSFGLVRTVVADRPTRLATLGYLGHMWELYAAWALIAGFFTAHFAARAGSGEPVVARASAAAFAMIAAGAVGAVLAGWFADRWGRERVATLSLLASGSVAAVIGWLIAAPTAVLLPLALVWGAAVVADSAQFSALVTEVAPPHAVGTALTLQTSAGFLLTAFSIALATVVVEHFGWGFAFALLVPGPAAGIVAMTRLRRLRDPPRLP